MKLGLGAVALIACSSPQPRAPASSRIAPEQCEALSTAQHDRCGLDRQRHHDACRTLSRVAEAASCAAQVQRAFACELQRVSSCSDPACCEAKSGSCDDTNTDFDHCVRGYCGSHGENPDCKWVLETWGT